MLSINLSPQTEICMKLNFVFLQQKIISIMCVFFLGEGGRHWISINSVFPPLLPPLPLWLSKFVRNCVGICESHIWSSCSYWTRTRAGEEWETREPIPVSRAWGLEGSLGLTMLPGTDLPELSLGGPLGSSHFQWFSCGWSVALVVDLPASDPLFPPIPALSFCKFSASLAHLLA